VDSTVQYISNTIGDFSFVNQNGKDHHSKDYEGKIYVADFSLPLAGAICPKMTANLFEVQKRLLIIRK
jgi:protein SCO1/2